MTYKESLTYLYAIPQFQTVGTAAYKPGLATAEAFDRECFNPARRLRCIHIAGTNGKGSTASMLYYALRSCGYSTGLFTSPHLKDFRERIEIDGEMIPENEVAGFVTAHKKFIEEHTPSFFEICSAMAFDHFARHNVDYAVIETGLGGRLDSTNIITPILSVITNIAFDHMAILGDTLEKIAAEKAGIIKPGIPALIGEHQETDDIFIRKAAETASPLTFAEDLFSLTSADGSLFRIKEAENTFTLDMTLTGDYQHRNVITALAAARLLDLPWDKALQGISSATIRGRWQILGHSPLTVCDTGHNPAGITYVTSQLARQKYDRLYFVLGIVNDKDFESIADLLPRDAHYIFTQASIQRAMPCQTLAARAEAHGLHGETVPTIPQALARAKALATPQDMIFIGGSTYTVAEII